MSYPHATGRITAVSFAPSVGTPARPAGASCKNGKMFESDALFDLQQDPADTTRFSDLAELPLAELMAPDWAAALAGRGRQAAVGAGFPGRRRSGRAPHPAAAVERPARIPPAARRRESPHRGAGPLSHAGARRRPLLFRRRADASAPPQPGEHLPGTRIGHGHSAARPRRPVSLGRARVSCS